MNNSEFSSQIVFKVRLDQEIKKIVIHNDEINYNELLLMMQRIFSEKIKVNDEFTIKYTDEENDLITLTNDSDVTLALQNSKSLKLTLFLKDSVEKHEEIKPIEILTELASIRASIDKFLEKFDKFLKLEINLQKFEDLTKKAADLKVFTSTSNHTVSNDLHKEFDPLNKRGGNEVVQQDFAGRFQKSSRAQTPDSITSIEFSDGHSKKNISEPTIQQSYVSSSSSLSASAKPSVNEAQANMVHHAPGLPTDHHLHQQQQMQQHHQQYQQQHFNGQQVQQQPVQPQQQQQQQQQHQPANQYYSNPTALKAPVPIQAQVSTQHVAVPSQAQQHPAISASQPQGYFSTSANAQQHGLQPQQNLDAHQQYYQQQQQQQQLYGQQLNQQQQPQQAPQLHPSTMQSLHQQQLNQQSPSNPAFPPNLIAGGPNPYSKTGALARPPSATYQPGYK